MRVAVTGTPGTGKTTATAELAADTDFDLEVIHVGEVLEREGLTLGVDEGRDSAIADLDALEGHLAGAEDALFESHLAHHLPADRVVVLRCAPEALERRLRERGEPEPKARENAESEALDVVLAEAVERHGLESVYEIDTTDREPSAVATAIAAACRGEREPSAGTVDYVGYLE